MEGLYSRSMLIDRSWMERRLESHGCSVTQQFKKEVEHFMDFAYSNAQFVTGVTIKCPCHKCALLKFQDRETATVHLYLWGFLSSYTTWSEHGESSTSDVNEPDVPKDNMQRVTENRYREMVIDAAGPDLRDFFFAKEAPNSNAAKFFELLRCADEPLWDGSKNHTRLSAVSLLMNVKSDCNMSESCYNRVVSAVKSMLPEDASFPDDFYQSKKMLKKLVLSYDKIHACPNDCMLFWKEHADKKKCMVCGHLRFKKGKEGRGKARTEVPFKVLRYLPLAPRLQRLFMSNKTAKYMSWHKSDRRPEGVLTHPCDGEAWKHIDRVYPLFAAEERNVRLGLSTDGFNPFGHTSEPYSCWPVFVTPYNLPPWMRMKEEVLFLTLIIPGPKSPGKNIDVYLRPLIEELKTLWKDGITTFDVSREQNFNMRAILLWTISDFPAYGMLSGWSTHGKMSCPYCMEKTKAFTLKSGDKPTFFDCHRQFLPLNHPYRYDKDKLFVGKVEKSRPPPRLSGEDLLKQLSKFPRTTFGKLVADQKWPGYGKDHNWTKKCIFWELPYWRRNLIRHNLDVMHIEKNIFENVFNTVMDVKGKTKDNIKSREDLKRYCKRPNLHMFEQRGKLMKPKAQFTLSKSKIRTICEWMKQLKFPDGYSSNISKCVNLDDCKLYGLKSHDCHVFMERLIPIAYVGQSIGGRGKVVGQSSSSVMNAYVGQSYYSGGRGNCDEQNNNAATNAYVGQSIGGRGKVVGQSSSSAMNVGQSSYSGGRGKSIGHSTHYVKKVYVPEAHRPQSPNLTPQSPASNNASTPTVDSPTAHEVEVNSGTSRATSSTDHESLVEGNETRGAYLSKNIPTKETDKKIIHIVGRNYLEQFAVRAIIVDFKAHFKGKESQWHRLDKRLVDLYYKSFQDRFRYEADVTPELAREVWEERASIRCRGTWACVRRQCKKVTGSTNPADWRAHRPVFVHQRDWEGILDSWMTEEWIRLSVSGTANRKKVPGENEGGCMYVRHTGGSVNFGIHCQRLETILGKRPNKIQLFERVHKKAKGKGEWCETRAEKVARKYHEKIKDKHVQEGDDGEQPLPSDIPFDGKVWIEVIGIPKKKQVYGFGLTEEAENILHESGYSTSSKKFKTCSSSNNLTQAEIELCIQEEVDARLAVRVEEVRMEMNQKMQEQMLKMFQEHLKSLK